MARFSAVSSLLLLIGTIMGVGMFGIPFVFASAGFLTGLVELLILAVAVTLIHLAYLDIVLRTPAFHSLPGYVRLYLGRVPGWLSFGSYFFSLSGALLAYLVLGGFFLGSLLHSLFGTIPQEAGPAIFYLIGVFVIFRSFRFEGFANALLTLFLIFAVVLLTMALVPAISPRALAAFHPNRAFAAFGVILFSLTGAAAIPEMCRFLGNTRARRGLLVALGTIIPAVLYLLFAAAVVGTTGDATTQDAISGLAAHFGRSYLLLGSVIGFLAAITSFIALGSVLEGMFATDIGVPSRTAPFLVAAIPLVLYLAGLKDFIAVVSVVGALALGLDAILILLMHARAGRRTAQSREFRLSLPAVIRVILLAVFGLGIVLELVTFL